MLTEIAIENFAIIDELLVHFSEGLTVLTGETGAGKSIIVDALQAALGGRVGGDVVRAGSRSATVEAIFDLRENQAGPIFVLLDEQGIELDGTLILRREVNAGGRSTARINGRAVPIGVLEALGNLLVDIHGQSEHLSILRTERQLAALDRFGDLEELAEQTKLAIREYVRLKRELSALSAGRREAEQRLDLLRFQVREIEEAGLRALEEDALALERTRLANSVRLSELAGQAHQALQGEGNVIEKMSGVQSALQELSQLDPRLGGLLERVTNLSYEAQDIGSELRAYADEIEFDPRRLDALEERLDLLTRLKRKYGASIEEVIAFGENARRSLDDVENYEERLELLAKEVEEAEAAAASAATALSLERGRAADRMDAEVTKALGDLGLTGTTFEVSLTKALSSDGLPIGGEKYSLGPHGVDHVDFMVSFNPGEPLRPFAKVASGGETSRFLLALKSVLSRADQTPTLVFDEVDVGVGARHGRVVGEKLRDLARDHQVLSITHLPQIAALADEHLRVGKASSGDRTTIQVRELEPAERVVEIAQMMSGTETETARRNAEELLQSAGRL